MEQSFSPEDIELLAQMQEDPFIFLEAAFGLIPQPILPEYADEYNRIISLSFDEWEAGKKQIRAFWFKGTFIKGKHLTWQQTLVVLCVKKAINKHASQKISIVSGHGTGKSNIISELILWFLFCFENAQVPCTAPTSDQMYDVLWKELDMLITRLDERFKPYFQWESSHIRMKEMPNTWFARAKTASKENPEALAGVHADHVLMVVDEASGVHEQIFNTAEGALTNDNILVILISNGTRAMGFFYDTHHKDSHNWQNLSLSSEESPIVAPDYVSRMEERHGRGTAEFKIRVSGGFPDEDAIDDTGYVPLYGEKDINWLKTGDYTFPNISDKILGVDPSGEGEDETVWVLRDHLTAKKVASEKKSTPKGIAMKTMTLMALYGVHPSDVVVDSFGVGADVAKEIALASKGRMDVTTVNVGETADYELDQELYLNKRAEAFYKSREWCRQGGQLVYDSHWEEEAKSIRFRRNMKGKIQIMPKLDMKKKYGFASPNIMDAFMLTFLRDIAMKQTREEKEMAEADRQSGFDKHSVW